MQAMMKSQIQQMIRSRRANPVMHHAAGLCERFLRAYHNEDFYDRDKNGEERIVRLFLRHCGIAAPVVWDVGAHRGHWALAVARENPDAQVYCFEIVGEIREVLKGRTARWPNVHVLDCGLSSGSGPVDVTCNEAHDSTNAIRPRLDSALFNGKTRVVSETVARGDALLRTLKLSGLDFLKIDVEGHEYDVIRGFSNVLSTPSAPRVLQFEYGQTYLPERRSLQDIYALLQPGGYLIGRIFPRQVEFKPYEPADEHFRMGNYLAVKREDPLINVVSSLP